MPVTTKDLGGTPKKKSSKKQDATPEAALERTTSRVNSAVAMESPFPPGRKTPDENLEETAEATVEGAEPPSRERIGGSKKKSAGSLEVTPNPASAGGPVRIQYQGSKGRIHIEGPGGSGSASLRTPMEDGGLGHSFYLPGTYTVSMPGTKASVEVVVR